MKEDANGVQAIAPLPDAKHKSRAQMVLLNQAMREDELARKAFRESKGLRNQADAKELEANRLHAQACELRAAARRLEE
jgi:hypothetical protein